MAHIREKTLGNFTDEELLEIVMKNLDELSIAYEKSSGGLGDILALDPADFDEE